MFNKTECHVTSLPSTWKNSVKEDIVSSDKTVATEKISVADQGCQSQTSKDAICQTEDYSKDIKHEVDSNEFKLLSFLQKVLPTMMKEMNLSRKTRAFDGCKFMENQTKISPEIVHELQWENSDKLSVSALSWNSTGTTIACGYSYLGHTHWCAHQSAVCIWNITRADFKSDKPLLILPTDGCVSSLSFHFSLPNILGAGSYNGDIILWNTTRIDDPLIGSSKTSVEGHYEPVTKLLWLKDSFMSSSTLLTIAIDGKLLLWKVPVVSKEGSGLEVLKKFNLFTGKSSGSFQPYQLGVTSASLSNFFPWNLYVGCEGGHVCLYNITQVNDKVVLNDSSGSNIFDKYCFKYHPSKVINTTTFKEFAAVVTISSDGQVLYHEEKEGSDSNMVFHFNKSIRCVAFHPSRESLLIAGDSDGNIEVIDFLVNYTDPVATINLQKNKGVTSLEWNKHNASVVAFGFESGVTSIYRMNINIQNTSKLDKKVFQNLLKGFIN